jgi:starvation-inducible outer membrane lipoprotein
MKYALIALLLSGCASLPAGVEMSDEERKACEEHGCTVWTRAELEHLARAMLQRGYAAGRKSL